MDSLLVWRMLLGFFSWYSGVSDAAKSKTFVLMLKTDRKFYPATNFWAIQNWLFSFAILQVIPKKLDASIALFFFEKVKLDFDANFGREYLKKTGNILGKKFHQ